MKSFSKMSFLRRIQKETLKLIEEKILLIGTFEAAADSLIKYNKVKYNDIVGTFKGTWLWRILSSSTGETSPTSSSSLLNPITTANSHLHFNDDYQRCFHRLKLKNCDLSIFVDFQTPLLFSPLYNAGRCLLHPFQSAKGLTIVLLLKRVVSDLTFISKSNNVRLITFGR